MPRLEPVEGPRPELVEGADFLLELLSEEIPARMQAKARQDLARLFEERIAALGLGAEAIETYATPRRLVLIARGMPLETEAVDEERKGPRADAPAQAIEGFLKSTGLSRDQLEERDDKKGGTTLFAVIRRPGRAAAAVLAEVIPAVIRAFPWPKSMRWGEASDSTASLRWVRPLQGIVALLGEQIVECEIAGLSSGAATVGHRFHHPGIITIGSANDYAEKLRACHVIVDPAEREAIIREGAARAAEAKGLAIVPDEELIVENAGLTEWPVPLLGSFDPAFLDVPREVIQLTMRANQKYFACTDASGALASNFICTANIEASDGGEAIVAGNRKVLAARLSDAKFFWEQDLKIPLPEQAKKLDQVVFHQRLGTMAQRVERMRRLVGEIAHFLPGLDRDKAERAAALAKADLMTGMVGEFPELQGTIGRYYAGRQGEPAEVADAIEAHYRPLGPSDECPSEPVSLAVALAEKIDILAGFFGIGERPTGSKDPFALRRAALALIRLVTENRLRAPLARLFPAAAALYRDQGFEVSDQDEELIAFIAERLKVQQRGAGVRHDLIDAVFSLGGEDDLVRLLARVNALQGFVETREGGDLLTGYKRAANILRKENWSGAGTSPAAHEPELEEAALIGALDDAEPRAELAVAAEDFEGAMAALASLRAPVDAFFDKVTVNDPDPAKREARLALLARMRDAVHRVGDFSKIEG
ncbi:MAG TPA: glycine--tRNA ligase subunit beta [Allosphingosinicella sp.]|nr:glycine--tRNA ligase subunit beta [Allosphingosinicella sp.]